MIAERMKLLAKLLASEPETLAEPKCGAVLSALVRAPAPEREWLRHCWMWQRQARELKLAPEERR